jgi:hypothetical protein
MVLVISAMGFIATATVATFQRNGSDSSSLMKVEANPILATVPVPTAAWLMGFGLFGLASL